jgi:uncharacterized membrane protein YdjX (TVP38/TMEM64 family)
VAVGTSICFGLSFFIGQGILRSFNKEDQVESFKETVSLNRNRILPMMLASRVSPVPNVVINVVSPLVGVPFWAFCRYQLIVPLLTTSLYPTHSLYYNNLHSDAPLLGMFYY